MIDLCDILIERDEFEIAQCYRLFRRLQPFRAGTLSLLEKIRGGLNFSLDVDVALVREIVGGDKPRKMQEELGSPNPNSPALDTLLTRDAQQIDRKSVV